MSTRVSRPGDRKQQKARGFILLAMKNIKSERLKSGHLECAVICRFENKKQRSNVLDSTTPHNELNTLHKTSRKINVQF